MTAVMLAAGLARTVSAVTSVHKEMNQGACQHEDVRDGTEDVCSVLFPQEEECDCEKQAEANPQRKSKRPPRRVLFTCCLHC